MTKGERMNSWNFKTLKVKRKFIWTIVTNSEAMYPTPCIKPLVTTIAQDPTELSEPIDSIYFRQFMNL